MNVRAVLTALGSAFAVYLGARGLVWADGMPSSPGLIVAMVALYLITAALCMFADARAQPRTSAVVDEEEGISLLTPGPGGPARLPVWACVLALLAAVLVPNLTVLALTAEGRGTVSGTWYVGAVGLLMAIVMVRRRPWVAWGGIVLLAATLVGWLGVLPALTLGLIGSTMWVLAAQLLVYSLDRATRDTLRLSQLQRAASAWRAAQLGRQRERRIQVKRALAVAGPILTRTIETGAVLSDSERGEARIAEGQLRDELRGARLLDDGVRAELDAARRRGTTVSVLDEGGLEGLSDSELAVIRAELTAAVHDAGSDRLFIRASTDPRVAVTIVGRSASGGALSDEDSVDLWREIARPA